MLYIFFGDGKSTLSMNVIIINNKVKININFIENLMSCVRRLLLFFYKIALLFSIFKLRHICDFSTKNIMKSNNNLVLLGMMGSGKSIGLCYQKG